MLRSHFRCLSSCLTTSAPTRPLFAGACLFKATQVRLMPEETSMSRKEHLYGSKKEMETRSKLAEQEESAGGEGWEVNGDAALEATEFSNKEFWNVNEARVPEAWGPCPKRTSPHFRKEAERKLEKPLPDAYYELLDKSETNGGVPKRRAFPHPTDPTLFYEINRIFGIAKSSGGITGRQADCLSRGVPKQHMVYFADSDNYRELWALDYRNSGKIKGKGKRERNTHDGEPSIVHVELEETEIPSLHPPVIETELAPNFATFIKMLKDVELEEIPKEEQLGAAAAAAAGAVVADIDDLLEPMAPAPLNGQTSAEPGADELADSKETSAALVLDL